MTVNAIGVYCLGQLIVILHVKKKCENMMKRGMEFMKNKSYSYILYFTYVAICSLPAIRIQCTIHSHTYLLIVHRNWKYLARESGMHSKFHVVCCRFRFNKLKFNRFDAMRFDAMHAILHFKTFYTTTTVDSNGGLTMN